MTGLPRRSLPGPTPTTTSPLRRSTAAIAIVADQYDLLIGVDTHAATHSLTTITTSTGAGGEPVVFPNSPAGCDRAVNWIHRRTSGAQALVVVEGIGSYGAMLTDRVLASGLNVVEPAAMAAADRRGVGKTDALDAARIARAVLSSDLSRLRWPRCSGPRVALRVLVVAREEMSAERTRAINALTALLATIGLGLDARKTLTRQQINTVSGWRTREEDLTITTCRGEAVRLAKRICDFETELAENRATLNAMVAGQAPELLALTGIGSVVGAAILVAWSHPGRVRSEAALASLAGTCPIPASSGTTTRHRLNRGGDRGLNRALTTIVIVRMRTDATTRAYVARRRAEGRTTKEIMRSLKRYITRQLFRTLTNAHPVPNPA